MTITKDLGAVSAYAYAVEKGYTGTEEEFAELMASYATVAEQASQSAQTATEKAQQASASATSASQSADTASASSQTAQTAQQTASTKASEAQQSATTATTKAQEASQSASQSAQYAERADQSADQSRQYASQSAQYAENASQSAQASAQSASQSAQYAERADQSADQSRQYASQSAQYAESIDPQKLIGAYPVDTASGSIASFPDGADNIPLKSLVVNIDPVQNLHGQDSPYPAGGGKNKYSGQYLAVESVYINLFGTRSTSDIATYGMDVKANTTYAVTIIMPSTLPTSARWGVYGRYAESTSNIAFSMNDVGATRTFTFTPAADTKVIMWGYLSGGETWADVGVTEQFLKIQIEEGTTATAWSPYENICPISGWDSVAVSHSGVNVWDEEWEEGTINNNTGLPSPDPDNIRAKNYCSCKPNTSFFILGGNEKIIRLYWYDAEKNFISTEIGKNVVITSPENARYFKVRTTGTYGGTYNHDISINYPSTDHDYHPYSGNSLSIPLPQTVYGGTLDVTNGVLTVDRASIASYNGETLPSEWISDRDKYVAGTAPTTGAQVVYKLATPITYHLTPTEIKSLLGDNNVWADCGDTTVTYRADTTLYINRKIAEAISALS